MILSFLNNLDDLHKENRVNPTLMSTIIKSYQEGSYDQCIQAIVRYIEATESIDIFILYMAFSADLYINTNEVDEFPNKLTEYLSVLKKLAPTLSPIDRFEQTLKRGINTFCQMVELKINERIKSINVFDINGLIKIFNDFIAFNSTMAGVDLNAGKPVTDVIKVLNKVERLVERLSIKIDEEKPKDTAESEDQQNEEKADNKQDKRKYVDDFASSKWYKLVKKTAILQLLIKEKRLFEAAIVYQDVQDELAKFDPKKYFPGLFFPLYKTLAPNVRKIYEHIDMHSNSLQWHIAKQMYQTDESRFLKDLPLMMENSYQEEQFSQSNINEESYDESKGLLDDKTSLAESEEIKFNESDDQVDESIDVSDNENIEEMDELLNDIESIWDGAGLSEKA